MKKMETAEVLGLKIDSITIPDTIEIFQDTINNDDKVIVAHHNLHSAYIYKYNQTFRRFFEQADYIHADGVPLVYFSKFLGYNFELKNRITYIDWLPHILNFISESDKKLFYLGGEEEVVGKAKGVICQSYPNINIEVYHGFFDKKYSSFDNKAVKEKINCFSPDILMVGMGMPIQEEWILANYKDLNVNIILSCGACFDYVAGKINTPPRGLSKYGLEWLFRFINEPKRLFKRYFVEPFFLLPEFLKDLRRIKNES